MLILDSSLLLYFLRFTLANNEGMNSNLECSWNHEYFVSLAK